MKIYQIILSVTLLFCIVPTFSDAQFLKKVGKTVKQIATATVSDDEKKDDPRISNKEASIDEKENKNSSSTKNTSESDFDFEKHNITVLKAGSASYRSGEYFIESYSSIQCRDNKMFTTVVVGEMTEKERLSELGEGSGKDVAYIYENGEKKIETTVGNLDRNLNFLNQKDDWYYIKDVANTGDKNEYVKPGKSGTNYTISFKGKTYGPYLMVSQMIVDKAQTKFFATVSVTLKDLSNQTVHLLSNDGKLKPTDFGGDLLANLSFTNGCTIVSPANSIAIKMAKEENEAKQKQLQDQMTDAMMNRPNISNVTFFTGKKLNGILTASPWLDISGNNLFSMQPDAGNGLEAGLYLNGKKIAESNPQQGNGWCNAEGTNWAFFNYDYVNKKSHLIFKDGTDIIGVRHPRQIKMGDKTFVVWFMYNRTKTDEIRMCSKEL